MTTDPEVIARAVGRLEGQVSALAATSTAQHAALAQKIDQLTTQLVVLPALVIDVAKIKPEVENYIRWKNRVWGVVIGLIVAGGAMGQWIAKVAARVFLAGGS
jgi:hypothetical protein